MSNDLSIKIEEKYTDEISDTILSWQSRSRQRRDKHLILSKRMFISNIISSIPPIIIPIVMVFVSQAVVDPQTNKLISGIAFLISGISSALNQFFRFERMSQQHKIAADRYSEAIDALEFDMTRNEKFRIPADVMLERLKYQTTYLRFYSPSLQNVCVSTCISKGKPFQNTIEI